MKKTKPSAKYLAKLCQDLNWKLGRPTMYRVGEDYQDGHIYALVAPATKGPRLYSIVQVISNLGVVDFYRNSSFPSGQIIGAPIGQVCAALEVLLSDKPQKRNWLLTLTEKSAETLIMRLRSHFRYSMQIFYDKKVRVFSIEMSSMGRTLYPDESSQAEPNKKGKPVTLDEIRWDRISDYINGFMAGVKANEEP